jgi:hypothetical protein
MGTMEQRLNDQHTHSRDLRTHGRQKCCAGGEEKARKFGVFGHTFLAAKPG